jgi:hypothetical protein
MTSPPRTSIVGLWAGAVGIAAVLAFFAGAFARSMLGQPSWEHLTVLLGNWQPLIVGVLALIAAGGTILVTRRQTNGMRIRKRRRIASETYAFLAMMEAAAKAVVDDVEAARKLAAPITDDASAGYNVRGQVAYVAKTRVKKAGFPELRTACVRYGGQQVTPAFLQLDKAIDDVSAKVFIRQAISMEKVGEPVGIIEELNCIAVQAKSLRDEVGPEMQRCIALLAKTQEPDFP